jgi:uncharacterized protein
VNDDLYRLTDDGVVLSVHVQPGAGRTAVVGRHGTSLKVKVAAPPTQGRANDAVLELLAESFGLPSAQVELTAGASSRSKQVLLRDADQEAVEASLRTLLTDVSGLDRKDHRGR